MAKRSNNFTLKDSDVPLLDDLVARSGADSRSQWLRQIIRQLSNFPGNYATNEVEIVRKNR